MQKFMKGLLWTAIVLVAIGGLFRLLFLKAWTLPDDLQIGASVEPSLHHKDTVLLVTRGKRGFGELVRCKDPDDPGKWTVGRIIGIEGDVIEIKGRQVFVNGKPYQPKQACPERKYFYVHPNSEDHIELQCDVIEMGGDWHYRGHEKKVSPTATFKHEVGEGMVFLLSDNIDYHDDSRDYGALEATTCTEKIVFRLWSDAGFKDEDSRMTFIH